MPIKPGQVWQEDSSIILIRGLVWEPSAHRPLLTSPNISTEACGRQLLLALSELQGKLTAPDCLFWSLLSVFEYTPV